MKSLSEIKIQFIKLKDNLIFKQKYRLKRLNANRLFQDYIAGRKSILIVALVLILFYGVGFSSPQCLEVLHIKPLEAASIANNLLVAFISVLALSLTISAIILAIIQLANRKISISKLVFTKTFYIPLVYFGLLCIGVLAVLQLFNGEQPNIISPYIHTRIIVVSVYCFLFFLLLIILVFYKTFKFINFNHLIALYLDDVLQNIRMEIFENSAKSNFLSSKGKEVFQEINDAIEKEDNVILEKFLSVIEQASIINPNTTFLFALPDKMVSWHIRALSTNRFQIWHTLIAS